MNTGRFILSQIIDLVHRQTLDRIAKRYDPSGSFRHFGYRQQFMSRFSVNVSIDSLN